MTLFDSHAHCDDARYNAEYEGGTDKLIKDCFESGVVNIINIGTCVENSRASIELAHKYEGVYASCGIHPCEALGRDEVDSIICELEKLFRDEKAVAIGEIGLDYHWQDVPRDIQLLYFEKQMELAKKLNIPVIIHDREAHGDCLEMIKKFPEVKGVFHSFSGSPEMARELVKLGWYISFSGTVTFKNARVPKEACVVVPSDRLLIETDSPYLAPTPHRGTINMPSYVRLTCEEIARLRGVEPEEIAKITMSNAKRLFNIE
ncbi:MAG: TatD family hydrolase [Clostridia bacterium]|nr:TatD family hydrolase [Clostridia bacterium]